MGPKRGDEAAESSSMGQASRCKVGEAGMGLEFARIQPEAWGLGLDHSEGWGEGHEEEVGEGGSSRSCKGLLVTLVRSLDFLPKQGKSLKSVKQG